MWQEGLKFKYQINEVLSKEFFSVPMGSGILLSTFQSYSTLSTVVTMLHVISLGLIHLITFVHFKSSISLTVLAPGNHFSTISVSQSFVIIAVVIVTVTWKEKKSH